MKKSFAFVLSCFALLLLVGCGPSKPVLHFYTWDEYIDPEVVEDFKKQYNCEVQIELLNTNEAMIDEVRRSNVHYDVILPTNYAVEIMRNEQLLQKLNPELLPNVFANSDKSMAANNGDPNFEYSVPYYAGITGLGCLVNKCDPLPDSWTVFNCEDQKYLKRLSLLADMRETIGAALITLGYDINTTDDQQLEEAKKLVISWKQNIAKFGEEDLTVDLRSGKNFIIHYYSGDIMRMHATDDDSIQFVIPKEGAILNIDNFVIPKDAQNVELAHHFINFMCDKKNATRNMEYTKFIVCVNGAEEGVSKETLDIPGFLLLKDVKDNPFVIKNLDEKTREKYTNIWNEIME